jgi:hypothetical protein
MSLSGPEIAKIQKALASAFSRTELEMLVREHLDKNLDSITDAAIDEAAFRLVQWTERQGRTRDLIAAAYTANPMNQDVATLAAEFLTDKDLVAASAITALHNLIDNVQNDAVHMVEYLPDTHQFIVNKANLRRVIKGQRPEELARTGAVLRLMPIRELIAMILYDAWLTRASNNPDFLFDAKDVASSDIAQALELNIAELDLESKSARD